MPPPANSPDGPVADTAEAETDAGPARGGKGSVRDPERRCIATQAALPQSQMIRFVLSPSGEVTPDIAAKLPGRGAWITASREAIETAAKKNAFSRAFKTQVKVPQDIASLTEKLLIARILDQLGLARRAGDLILGFEQVREDLRRTRPALVIEASDGAEDGRDKLLALLLGAHGPVQGESPENRDLPGVVGCFSADELGMALGRGRVIHACLKQGRFATSWAGELTRLSGFRRVWLQDWAPGTGAAADGDVSNGPNSGDGN
jgi:uncharacterized protein